MRYANAAAFRAALEARLNAAARQGGRPVGRARKLVAFTRLLARLEQAAPEHWVLKGGFALELRLAGHGRATKDVDIDWATSLEDAADALLAATALDLDDYFEFQMEKTGDNVLGVGGGVRFRADALLSGRLFERLPIDIGVGDALLPSDELTAPDLLAFADIEAPRIRAVPLEQHIAEKLHAYTRRYGPAAASSRPKDLIDLILISEITDFNFSRLREVIVSVFEARASHNLPLLLPTRQETGRGPTASSPMRLALIPIR